jgi:hypothetical protein
MAEQTHPLHPGKAREKDTMKYFALIVVGVLTMAYSTFEIFQAMQQGTQFLWSAPYSFKSRWPSYLTGFTISLM